MHLYYMFTLNIAIMRVELRHWKFCKFAYRHFREIFGLNLNISFSFLEFFVQSIVLLESLNYTENFDDIFHSVQTIPWLLDHLVFWWRDCFFKMRNFFNTLRQPSSFKLKIQNNEFIFSLFKISRPISKFLHCLIQLSMFFKAIHFEN